MGRGAILAPKWPNFDHFHQKMTYFDQTDPINDILTKFMYINLTEIIFWNIFRKNFWPLSLNFGLRRYFAPKWPNFDHFHQKWPILTPLMTFLTKFMSINLTEIIFRNILRKNFLTTFPKFWPVAPLWPQNDPILTIFTKNELFWTNWPH